ncbi:SDR family NAD(P)-dependent oxidoreductase [Burkholderia sp. BCC0405]|uniref:SDR family NAD(P)-dependent oxidoreductase n=1 Tax=Burkholderia sp. BCC0405 TaxID=2676298 RepID=UPI00158CD802|nr:SDR family NAD(P)-dependent oxidoreductase [Burkholderia sp. BCC0405]
MSDRRDRNAALEGRRILVTGAASGIGLKTVEVFVAAGADVVLLDRNAHAVTAAASQLGKRGLVADIGNFAELELAVHESADLMHGLDGIVNMAGITIGKPLEDTSLADWDRVIRINLTGTFNVLKAAVPLLLQCQKPTVVTVASSMGLSPTGRDPAYTASKGGVIALTKAIAASHAPRLRANVICPGAVNTPMLRATVSDEALANIVRQNPMKRIAEPEEVAEAALFLTSDASSYITGTALAVEGGRILH